VLSLSKVYCLTIGLISLLLTLAVGTLAAEDPVAQTKPLSALEDQFFEQEYTDESSEARLERLEKFIYGCTQSGPIDARLSRILSMVSVNKTSNPTKTSTPLPDTDKQQVANSSDASSGGNTDDYSGHSPFDSSSYPRVISLEQQLLGSSYASEPLEKRVERLETKAFGSPSTSRDLCQRVDRLDDYADRHNLYGEKSILNPTVALDSNQKNFKQSSGSVNSDQDNQPFMGSVLERISMMEAQEFDHTSVDKPLNTRINKLEKKILRGQKLTNESDQNFSDLSVTERVNRLWLSLHPHNNDKETPLLTATVPQDNSTGNTRFAASNADRSQRQSWLHNVAKTMGSNGGAIMNSVGVPGAYPYYTSGVAGTNNSPTYPGANSYMYPGGSNFDSSLFPAGSRYRSAGLMW